MLLHSSRSWSVVVDGALTLLKILECRGGWCSYAPQDLGVKRWMVLLRSSRSWSVEVDGAVTLLKIWSVEVDGALTLLKISECRGGWCSYAPQDLGV